MASVKYYGTGRRKKSIARVYLTPGTGKIKGMLPKGPLGRAMIKKLHVYAGPEHNHAAQKPEVLELKY